MVESEHQVYWKALVGIEGVSVFDWPNETECVLLVNDSGTTHSLTLESITVFQKLLDLRLANTETLLSALGYTAQEVDHELISAVNVILDDLSIIDLVSPVTSC